MTGQAGRASPVPVVLKRLITNVQKHGGVKPPLRKPTHSRRGGVYPIRYNMQLGWRVPADQSRCIGWGGSKKDLLALPSEVVDVFGYALYLAQIGRKHEQARPLKGFGSAGVIEVIEHWQGDPYRAVYTVRFAPGVFVLHVFQKKSKQGRATPKRDLALIRERLKAAEQAAKEFEP